LPVCLAKYLPIVVFPAPIIPTKKILPFPFGVMFFALIFVVLDDPMGTIVAEKPLYAQ
jgi:hypothetical protein